MVFGINPSGDRAIGRGFGVGFSMAGVGVCFRNDAAVKFPFLVVSGLLVAGNPFKYATISAVVFNVRDVVSPFAKSATNFSKPFVNSDSGIFPVTSPLSSTSMAKKFRPSTLVKIRPNVERGNLCGLRTISPTPVGRSKRHAISYK